MPDDRFQGVGGGLSDPAVDAFTVVPSDGTNFATDARSLYVGGAGDVRLLTDAGNLVTFPAVPAGAILPVRCQRVNVTGTTASNMVGLV